MARVSSAYFLASRAVVNEVDPVGLIEMGAPADEYDPEIEDLIKRRELVTAERVAEVFIRWFGPATGSMSVADAARIAHGINAARDLYVPLLGADRLGPQLPCSVGR